MYGACLHLTEMTEITVTFCGVAYLLSLQVTAYQQQSVVLHH